MFTVCVGLVFRGKYVQFPIICPLQYSININTVGFTAYLHSETQEYKRITSNVHFLSDRKSVFISLSVFWASG